MSSEPQKPSTIITRKTVHSIAKQNNIHFMSYLKRFGYFMIVSGTALISLWAWLLVSPKTYSGTETITLSGAAYNPQTRWEDLRSNKFQDSEVNHDLKNIAKLIIIKMLIKPLIKYAVCTFKPKILFISCREFIRHLQI